MKFFIDVTFRSSRAVWQSGITFFLCIYILKVYEILITYSEVSKIKIFRKVYEMLVQQYKSGKDIWATDKKIFLEDNSFGLSGFSKV